MLSGYSSLSLAHKQNSRFSTACLGTEEGYRCESREGSLWGPAGALPTWTRVRDNDRENTSSIWSLFSGTGQLDTLVSHPGLPSSQFDYFDFSLSHLCENLRHSIKIRKFHVSKSK